MIGEVLGFLTGVGILCMLAYLTILEIKKLQNDERKR